MTPPEQWNQTAIEYRSRPVHELLEEQAQRTPDAQALVFEDQAVTYDELHRRANRLARHLVRLGVGPESIVGICMERSPEMMVGLLAILKAGGAYLPLDPAYPARRTEFILEEARVQVVLTQKRLQARIPPAQSAVCVDSLEEFLDREDPGHLAARAEPHNLAYVIYTSGSTGTPKGVMIEHRNVANFFAAMDLAIGAKPPGVWLAVTSISFDISVLELLWTLARGFVVVLHGGDGERARGGRFSIARQIRKHGVTHLQCTPSLARMLVSDDESFRALGALRTLLLGGEALPPALLERLRQVVTGDIYNMYGPTETTIWSTSYRLRGPGDKVPIGTPIGNTRTYILDERMRPVAVGEAGELHIAGSGVARGYYKRPELTAERFLMDPFSGDTGGLLYKTGDVARYLPDGNIEYLGRADSQVKIRGHRIELGEIEAVLERYPAVRQAVVVAREDKPGDQRLVAYVVWRDGARDGDGGLRRYLKEQLPEHMLPAAFVALAGMPLTENGKINRGALPVPLEPAAVPAAAGTGLERTIAEVWKDALHVDRVGIHDNFFDLGAHSLQVAEVNTRLAEVLSREIPLVTMFRYPTISLLAAHLGGESEGTVSLAHSSGRAGARRQSLPRRAAN